MKVISVTGLSGSGKTTFIRALIPHLVKLGTVGTLKHTGHHSMELPKGKDTTLMFEAGANAVTGIDSEKLLVTLRGNSVPDALDLLSYRGTDIAVIEGFKESRLPKVMIGDLENPYCILRNPTVEEVLQNIWQFPEYFTLDELVRDIRRNFAFSESGEKILTWRSHLKEGCSYAEIQEVKTLCKHCETEQNSPSGTFIMRADVRNGNLFDGPNELLIAITARERETGIKQLVKILKMFNNYL